MWLDACNNMRIHCREHYAILRTIYRRYLIDAMSAMALGLFSSLIIGLILAQLARIRWQVEGIC